jgi:glycerol-3-phosphate dehydrogenase
LKPFFPGMRQPWTASAKLPGGGVSYNAVTQEVTRLQEKYSFLKSQNVLRLFRAYGSDVETILGEARFAADLGKWFGPLCEREIEHLTRNEWAVTADDILWRRSKLGLHLRKEEIDALRAHMEGAEASAAKKPAKRRKA